jgi:hypothetical protein
MSVREEIRAGKIHLAAGNEWNGFADASAALDVTRGDRLEATGAHGTSDCGLSGESFQPHTFFLFFCFFYAHFSCVQKQFWHTARND